MGSVPMALALLVLQSAAGTLRLSDLARVYARRTEISDGTMMDVRDTPRVELGVAWPSTRVDLAYAPRFSWMDVLGDSPSPTLVLHDAELLLSWEQPRVALIFGQTVTIGDQDFTELGTTTAIDGELMAPGAVGDVMMPGDIELLPAAEVLSVFAEETSAQLRYDWSRRWSSDLRAAFGFSGGADAEAQVFLPQQRTAQLDAAVGFRRSPRDELTTAASVAQIETSNGYDHWVVSLDELWTMRWARQSGGELGLGMAIQNTTGPTGLTTTDWEPVGSASAWHEVLLHAMQVRFQWDVGYRPDVNVLAGTLQSRLFTTVQAALTVDRSSLLLIVRAAQTLPRDAPDANELIGADLVFEQALADWLDLQLGAQIVRQSVGGSTVTTSSGSRWLLYAGLEARLPEVRF
jgi:hypothetical protein